ncbi:MAG TPA: glutathione S-transferase [Rhodospirillaceae bacterium]|nr:glutathione S-transferase [Rhodospirillaceae bacterium]
MTIELYLWATPNGRKISIMLEELGLPYEEKAVNIGKGEQFEPDFLKISPNNRIPAIIDPDGPDGEAVSVFESAAILIYLAEKTGKLVPADPRKRIACLEWLMWQMGGYGPILGQVHHFTKYNPDASEYARKRYESEARRLYGVLDRRLDGRDYIVDGYSIADMAVWPWAARHNWQEIDLNDFPNVRRWYMSVLERPAVQRAWNIPENDQPLPIPE